MAENKSKKFREALKDFDDKQCVFRSLSRTSMLLQTPQLELIGSRVVRGPDWKWNKQDGGEGHVGTIRKFESYEEVVVVWDNGKGANYRCAGDYDIRILESSPTGLVHEKIKCNECGQFPLQGIRWVCANCLKHEDKNINLCSKCYHSDQHSLKHKFFRLLTQTSEKILVKSRKKSKKISYKGLYPGARVVRGIDWIWENQDEDNSNSKGTIISLYDWNNKSPLSAVLVKWDNGLENMYRAGYKGKTDLKSKIEAKGGYYYPDHLPLLGERTIIKKISKNINTLKILNASLSNLKDQSLDEDFLSIRKNSSTFNSTENIKISQASSCNSSLFESGGVNLNPMLIDYSKSLKINDRVNIDLDFETVQSLQVGHGGWSEDMYECLGNTGQITAIDLDCDFEVTYPSGNKWTLNPAILTLANQTNKSYDLNNELHDLNNIQVANFYSSHVNLDLISFLENNLSSKSNSEPKLNTCRLNKPMKPDKLEENCYVKISSDLELVKKLQHGHGEWKESMNQILGQNGKVICVHDETDVLVEVNGKNWLFNRLVLKKKEEFDFNFDKDPLKELVKASASGDGVKCELIIKRWIEQIDKQYNGHGALHACSHNGHLHILKMLLNINANVEIGDLDGDTALHHAAMGNQVKVAEILYEKAVDKKKFVNLKNKKAQTAMHIAVCMENLDMVKCLAKLGINLNLQDQNGDTALHDSILIKNEKILSIILNSNADLKILNNMNFNPIHYAALKGNANAMRLIITRLIKIKKYWLIDERKLDGFSALHIACLNNHFEVVKVLIENGNLNINIKNDAEQTPLHLAVDRLNLDIIKLLCTFKYPTEQKIRCNINSQNKDGDSPLHCLLKNFSFSQLIKNNSAEQLKEKYVFVACFLIENGADIFLKNKSDQIPFDFCYDFELVKFLFNFTNGLNKRFEKFFINENSNEHRIVKFLNEDYDICILCLSKRRDILLKPCNHILVCNQCSINCYKCFRCECFVKETVRIGICVLCKSRISSYLFEPCGHMIMCSDCAKTIKYCIKCKRLIEKLVSYKEVCFINSHLANETIILDQKRYVIRLRELNSLKERATCQLCKEAFSNLIFFCGHSTCKSCGEQLKNCPICDSMIFKKILLFQSSQN